MHRNKSNYLQNDNWRFKTIAALEQQDFGNPSNAATPMVMRCLELCRVSLNKFTPGDLRLMIEQRFALKYLVPLAIEYLKDDIFAEGDYYPGDLLNSVLTVDKGFWIAHKEMWMQVNELIKDRRNELAGEEISTTLFDEAQ